MKERNILKDLLHFIVILTLCLEGVILLSLAPAASAGCMLVSKDVAYSNPTASGYYEYLSEVKIEAGDEVHLNLTLQENPAASMLIVHVVFYTLPLNSDAVHYHDIHLDRMPDGTILRTFSPDGSDPFTESYVEEMSITINDVFEAIPPGSYQFALEIEAHFEAGGGAHLDAEIYTTGDNCSPAPGAVSTAEAGENIELPIIILCEAEGIEIYPVTGETDGFEIQVNYEEIAAAIDLKLTRNYLLQSSENGHVRLYLLPGGTHLQVRIPGITSGDERVFTFPVCSKP